MTKSSSKIKKTLFWHISPNLGAKLFSQKFSCHAKLHIVFQHHVEIQKKTYDTIPRKHLDRRKDGRADRPSFIGPLRLPLGVQKHNACSYGYYGYKLVCFDTFSKPFKTYLGKDAVYNFISSTIKESKYCNDTIKKT